MVMPDDKNITWRNSIGMCLVLAASYLVALLLHTFSATVLEVCLACIGMALASLLLINRLARATAENYSYQLWSGRFVTVAGAALVCGILLQLILAGSTPGTITTTSHTHTPDLPCYCGCYCSFFYQDSLH